MAETEETPKPQSNRNRTLMQLAGGLVLMLAGGGGGYLAHGILNPDAAATEGATEGEAKAEGEVKAEGEAKAEGEGHAEGEAKAEGEGHGEAKAEGEGAKAEGEGHGAKAEGEGHGAKAEAMPEPPTLDNGHVITNLKTFVVNLRSSGGGRVLRMEVQLESSKEVAPHLDVNTPRLRDTILTAVSDYTFTELEGTDGKTRLRDELLTRINGTMAPMTIDQVYFTQFVVQ